MNPSDCRREYKKFCAAFEQARFAHFNGFESDAHFGEINERYADLWTRENIDEIVRAFEETPAEFATERAALHALAGRLRRGFCEAQTRAIGVELKICENSSRIAWRGEKIPTHRAPALLANLTDANDRRELAARFYDALAACDDLRAVIFNAQREATRALGFDSPRALLEDIAEQNFAPLAARATTFLERTQRIYSSALAAWANETFDAQTARRLTTAESFALERAANLDAHLRVEESAKLLRAVLSDFSIRGEPQKIEWRASSSENLASHGAVCCPVNPPDDVRAVFETEHGAQSVLRFFNVAGRAQRFAWVSRDLATRYPEFIRAPDKSTEFAFAALFENFFQDEAWLAAHLGIKTDAARTISRFAALRSFYELRAACASMGCGLMLDAADDPRDAQVAETFAALYSEATHFEFSRALCLQDVQNALENSTTKIRALLFCAALRERFRTRYGNAWWQTHGARDALIDMWNTGSRYGVEELARLNDIGELSFDLLADFFNESLRDE